MMRVRIILGVMAVAVSIGGWKGYAALKPNYTLNETQKMRLQLKQAQAVNLKVQYDQVQSQLTAKLQEFDAECSKIKKENNLPDTAVCDINNPGVVKPPEQVKK